MQKTTGRLRLCAALLTANILFIWGNSLLPGEISGAVSGFVKDVVFAILGIGGEVEHAGHGLLRKIGHLTEFACLGACLCWLLSMLGKKPWLSILCGFPVACLDEIIQRFVPDRGPSFWDVCIDTAGVSLGTALLLGGFAIYQKRKKVNSLGGN